VEFSDNESIKMSVSHLDIKDDIKSVRSLKSKGSIRSELPVGETKLKLKTIDHQDINKSLQDSESEEDSDHAE